MRGGHYFSIGYDYYSLFLILGMVGLVAILITYFGNYFKKKRPEHDRALNILFSRYENGKMNFEEYQEVKAILEDESAEDEAMNIIKKRYALGEIDSREFIKMRDTLA